MDNIAVTVDAQGKVNIAEHTLGVSYPALLLFVLDQVIIPSVWGGCHNTGCMLGKVDCGSARRSGRRCSGRAEFG